MSSRTLAPANMELVTAQCVFVGGSSVDIKVEDDMCEIPCDGDDQPSTAAGMYAFSDAMFSAFMCISITPFSCDRQHLSYGGCLEVRGEIIRTVLCCIV